MDIRQSMKRKSISNSLSEESISDKRLRTEVQPALGLRKTFFYKTTHRLFYVF